MVQNWNQYLGYGYPGSMATGHALADLSLFVGERLSGAGALVSATRAAVAIVITRPFSHPDLQPDLHPDQLTLLELLVLRPA